jgi:hypothetical protein
MTLEREQLPVVKVMCDNPVRHRLERVNQFTRLAVDGPWVEVTALPQTGHGKTTAVILRDNAPTAVATSAAGQTTVATGGRDANDDRRIRQPLRCTRCGRGSIDIPLTGPRLQTLLTGIVNTMESRSSIAPLFEVELGALLAL